MAQSTSDIEKCARVMLVLRPQINAAAFVPTVEQMMREGYQLALIEENGEAVSAIGLRHLHFLFCGRHFSIADLTTLPEHRGKGHAGDLLDFVTDLARRQGLDCITLASGHQRHTAHRLYLNKGFHINCHHFTKPL